MSSSVTIPSVEEGVFGFSLLWHKRFMDKARAIATYSKDHYAQVGSVIVGEGKETMAEGYNGYPRALISEGQWFSDRDFIRSNIVHAEANALMNALRTGSRVTNGYLYTTRPPCGSCVGLLSQAGIRGVVCLVPEPDYWLDHSAVDLLERFSRLNLPFYFL